MAVAQRSKGFVSRGNYPPGDVRQVGQRVLAPAEVALPFEPTAEDRPALLRTIESEIIPRLMLAHRTVTASHPPCAPTRLPPSEQEVDEIAQRATCHDLSGALALVEKLCREGLSLEDVLLNLVAPAARLLGEQWLDDQRSFMEVWAGLGTLQQMLHVLSPSFAPNVPHRGLVVLIAAPGEQHTLGLYMVGEFLRRAGWGVLIEPAMSSADLVSLMASESVVMLGVTVSNADLLPTVSELLSAAREASCNPDLKVMLGGSIDLSSFSAQHDAYCCGTDPREAVRWLDLPAKVGKCIV